jgi:hypothetical protein
MLKAAVGVLDLAEQLAERWGLTLGAPLVTRA